MLSEVINKKVISILTLDFNHVKKQEVNIKQGDEGNRRVIFTGDYPDFDTIKIQGTKPDKHGFQYDANFDSDFSLVYFDIQEQMSTTPGRTLCDLQFIKDGAVVSTSSFYLIVSPSALGPDIDLSGSYIPEYTAEAKDARDAAIAAKDRSEEILEEIEKIPEINIDPELDPDSPNPVSNSAITQAISDVLDQIEEGVLEASVSKSGKTATITITDKSGTTSVDINDGEDGAAGPEGPKGEKGDKGDKGEQGPAGTNGTDGISPTAKISKAGPDATITITDKNGTTSAIISDGNHGISPTCIIQKYGQTATITIHDINGTTTAQINDGTDGTDGTDGHSITADSSKLGSATTVNFKDAVTGTILNTITLNDGADGNDYILTSTDKQDIADIVISEIGSADTTSY